ncbi:MAG: hypothetical protein ACJAZ0_002590 [Halioglobus sp.]|jgi:hypothetical protein
MRIKSFKSFRSYLLNPNHISSVSKTADKRARVFAAILACFFGAAMAQELRFTQAPSLLTVDGEYRIPFAISEAVDVEVAVVNEQGEVVRHLAAGMLGGESPPQLKSNSLMQSVAWDGRDD